MYGEAFWEYGFEVYDMRPINITGSNYDITDPLTGHLAYPNTTYDYPTIQLLFWSFMSIMPFPEITAKWVLSFFDIINFILLGYILQKSKDKDEEFPKKDKIFLLSYVLFSIPFSAIEGQSTSLMVFFLIIPLVIYEKNEVLSYISIGVGFHWKYVSFLILPYLLIKDRNNLKTIIIGLFSLIVTVIVLSIPPLLVSKFVLRYFGFFGNLGSYSGQTPSNPLVLTHFSISSILSSIILLLGIYYWFGGDIFQNRLKLDNIKLSSVFEKGYWIPFLLLLLFLKFYSTAFPWYWMWFFPCLVIFPDRERGIFYDLLIITFSIGLFDFVDITIGFFTFLGYFL